MGPACPGVTDGVCGWLQAPTHAQRLPCRESCEGSTRHWPPLPIPGTFQPGQVRHCRSFSSRIPVETEPHCSPRPDLADHRGLFGEGCGCSW